MDVEIRFRRRDHRQFTTDAIDRHVVRLAELDSQGRLIAAGPLADGSGGLILGSFASQEEAEDWALADPFVSEGYETVEVRPWTHAHRRNGYGVAGQPARPLPDEAFVSLPLDKRDWHPSPLPGQIVLVTTASATGEPDVAPKSWVSFAAFSGPVVGFGCNTAHQTSRNIEATGEFVVNVPDVSMAALVWRLIETQGAERIARSGLSLRPASLVRTPFVGEAVAYLECRHRRTVALEGDEIFVFGSIVAGWIAERCLAEDPRTAYHRLDPLFFLEDGWYASLGPPVTALP